MSIETVTYYCYTKDKFSIINQKQARAKPQTINKLEKLRLADLGSCTDCQQGGLLQLGSRWYPRPAARPAVVRLECCATHLVFSVRRSERITPLFRELHWLRVPERVTFRLCVLAYRCLHETAPAYFAESLHQTSDVDTRRRLRSSDSAMLVVPSTRRSTLGDRAFPVASARAWNSLPSSVRNAPSMTTFRRKLKTVLFWSSFDND